MAERCHTFGAPVLDLFCGAGGFMLGALQAGARGALGVDRWAPAVATARAAGHRVALAEVEDLDAWLPLLLEHPLIVTGGPPCQPFSVGGGGRGHEDARDGYPWEGPYIHRQVGNAVPPPLAAAVIGAVLRIHGGGGC